MKLPISISDFQILVEGKYQFVDKSLFVKEVIDNSAGVILITRPRRFGKTLNLSMLHYFLRMDMRCQDLFNNLAIIKDIEFCAKHQNQYPVIFITFKDVKQSHYANSYDFILDLIRRLYEEHRYLLEGNLLSEEEKLIFMGILKRTANFTDVSGSIRQLSEYMARKFKKRTVILIDEYDTPIQEAYLKGYYSEMIEFMRNMLGMALKDNSYLAKAVITGITRVSQESMFSGLNNIEAYSLLREEYGQYFGFTETEVSKLIGESSKEIQLSLIKEWYNGYQVGKYILYNPWSIISCLNNQGKFKAYWVNTSSNDLISELLSKASPNIKQQLEELLQGKIIEQPLSEDLVFSDIETSEEALWSLFLYAGYLKVLSSELVDYELMAKIAIPNKEVGVVYRKMVASWFSKSIDVKTYKQFVQSLASGDMKKFKMYLSSYIMQSGSYFDFNKNSPEQVFHVFILGLVVGLREHYYINSNQEAGMGRVDVIFIPHDKHKKGILLEFKVSEKEELLAEKVQEALNQIKDKQYLEVFKQHKVKNVLAIGLAFCGKQLELAHEELSLS